MDKFAIRVSFSYTWGYVSRNDSSASGTITDLVVRHTEKLNLPHIPCNVRATRLATHGSDMRLESSLAQHM